jgi:predicted transcriptional regulator
MGAIVYNTITMDTLFYQLPNHPDKNMETSETHYTMDQVGLVDIHRTFGPTATEPTFHNEMKTEINQKENKLNTQRLKSTLYINSRSLKKSTGKYKHFLKTNTMI